MDAWRTVLGIKTVAVRMERSSANAQVIAETMVKHPTFERLYYRGPEDHPGHELTARVFAERPSCSSL
jgi:cystathionine gamma-synthase